MVTEQTKAEAAEEARARRIARADEAVERIRQALEEGVIYNAEYADLKRVIDFGLESDRKLRDLLNELYWVAENLNRTSTRMLISDIRNILPFNLHGVAAAAARYEKILKTSKKGAVEVPTEVDTLAKAYFAKWLRARKIVVDAKEIVRKGRRPAENPNPNAKPRTLENTGTCPICGANVKRDGSGKLVRHGYTVQFGSFQGDCPGVGFLPWEVSPEGATKYADALGVYVVELEREYDKWNSEGLSKVWVERKKTYVEKGEPGFEAAFENLLAMRAHQIKSIKGQIEYYRGRVANWKPGILPGTKGASK